MGKPEPYPSLEEFLWITEEHRGQILARLPEVGAEIAGRISFELLYRLVDSHGGRNLYIPVRDQANTVREIGSASTETLRQIYGAGGYIPIPSRESVLRAIRRFMIIEHHARGMSHRATATKLGLSTRWVRMVISQTRQKT